NHFVLQTIENRPGKRAEPSAPAMSGRRIGKPAGHSGCPRFDAKAAGVLGLLLTAFVTLQYFLPLRTAIKIGADEDFELSKPTLCLNGYQLYTEIWDDQPPLYTFLITQILRRVSSSVLGPRLLTVGFAALLLCGT